MSALDPQSASPAASAGQGAPAQSPPGLAFLERFARRADAAVLGGAIDEFVTKSLLAAFGERVLPEERATEERKWRDVLCQLVTIDANGTPRAGALEAAAVVRYARELAVASDIDAVVDHLCRPDVWLLRKLDAETASAAAAPRLGLGHDAVAKVLDRWTHCFPPEPYKGLAYYDAVDRRLLSGRDDDIDVCVERLTASQTRVLLIHGHTGCGKSSFLRAGLIPEIEGLDFGYLFLRDAGGAPLFVRSGADPLGRLAECIYHFASTPVMVRKATGSIACDLSEALLGHPDAAAFVKDCRQHGGLKKSLQIISEKLPYTLVVILDQMEEVITLHESGTPYRRQFFQFIKSFSTGNFSVKFVLALRKDYSGQFIELAQPNAGVELREPPRKTQESHEAKGADEVRETPQDWLVRSDVKLYLLPELDQDKVRRAIELPASKVPVCGGKSPFDAYHFSFGPGVVDKILADLFKESGAAVLPALQIVCRELYQEAAPNADRTGKEITLAQYTKGKEIAGPIDRHVTKSLKTAFGSKVKEAELAGEEDKWREVLFKFVRLESDGTAHTRELPPGVVAKFAQDVGAVSDADAVIRYLTQPDVLLLRSVRSDLAGPDSSTRLSLGHDFIAMVLNRWNSGRAAKARARRFKRIASLVAGGVLGSLILIGVLTALSWQAGKAEQEYDVLRNTTKSVWRQQPMASIMTAAAATSVADQAALFEQRDVKADQMLADLLASLPDTQASFAPEDAGTGAANASTRVDGSFPLAQSNGFLSISDDRAKLMIGAPARTFDLKPLAGVDGPSSVRIVYASEVGAGVVMVLRMRVAQGGQPGLLDYKVDVLRADGTSLGPFGPEAFGERMAKESDSAAATTQQLTVTGRFVSFWKSTHPLSPTAPVNNEVHVYAYDDQSPTTPFKRVATFDNDSLGTGQANDAAFWFNGGRLVVQYGFSDQADLTAVRFDLNAPARDPVVLLGKDATPACAGVCAWKWLSFMPPDDTIMVYGAADPQKTAFQGQWSENSLTDLGNYKAFMLMDVSSGKKMVVESSEIDAARSTCSPFTAERADVPQAPSLEGARAFATRSPASPNPLLGIVSGGSVDLLEINASGATPHVVCRRSLVSPNPLELWAVTGDGKRLLGGGVTTLAGWNLPARGARPPARPTDPKELRRAACDHGLKEALASVDADQWRDLTHLSRMPRNLCGPVDKAAPAHASAPQR